jgi:hypothetical protein
VKRCVFKAKRRKTRDASGNTAKHRGILRNTANVCSYGRSLDLNGATHVSAALGCKTWIVIPLLPYYTWADMKKESYWYDSASLYRQKYWKKWDEPFDEVKKDLIKLLENK